MKPIISVQNLGKRYRIRQKTADAPTNFREVLAALPRKLCKGGPKTRTEEFWALDDVSFDIMPGERVGIIGRNGAGKSTLLKLLSRITEPTRGKITMRGRSASLLEVGTGFHPELTGRENIFLNGAILGMSRAEVSKKFDEIVAFAGVEKFLDTPVKRYSSGMYVRLGFAVAAHLEPEILIVDEVLAVGDAEFQKKCLGKMEEVSTGQGRTVLFVSHNMDAVMSLCTRGIYLQKGHVIIHDNMDVVCSTYFSALAQAKEKIESVARYHGVSVLYIETKQREYPKTFFVELKVDSDRSINELYCSMRIYNKNTSYALHINKKNINEYISLSKGINIITLSFDCVPLHGDGHFMIITLADGYGEPVLRIEDVPLELNFGRIADVEPRSILATHCCITVMSDC